MNELSRLLTNQSVTATCHLDRLNERHRDEETHITIGWQNNIHRSTYMYAHCTACRHK